MPFSKLATMTNLESLIKRNWKGWFKRSKESIELQTRLVENVMVRYHPPILPLQSLPKWQNHLQEMKEQQEMTEQQEEMPQRQIEMKTLMYLLKVCPWIISEQTDIKYTHVKLRRASALKLTYSVQITLITLYFSKHLQKPLLFFSYICLSFLFAVLHIADPFSYPY